MAESWVSKLAKKLDADDLSNSPGLSCEAVELDAADTEGNPGLDLCEELAALLGTGDGEADALRDTPSERCFFRTFPFSARAGEEPRDEEALAACGCDRCGMGIMRCGRKCILSDAHSLFSCLISST